MIYSILTDTNREYLEDARMTYKYQYFFWFEDNYFDAYTNNEFDAIITFKKNIEV